MGPRTPHVKSVNRPFNHWFYVFNQEKVPGQELMLNNTITYASIEALKSAKEAITTLLCVQEILAHFTKYVTIYNVSRLIGQKV